MFFGLGPRFLKYLFNARYLTVELRISDAEMVANFTYRMVLQKRANLSKLGRHRLNDVGDINRLVDAVEKRHFAVSRVVSDRLFLVVEVVNVGEVTGALDHVLEEVGSFYEDTMKRQIRLMTALFEPAMILLVGGAVGFVYFAFFQALFQLARM